MTALCYDNDVGTSVQLQTVIGIRLAVPQGTRASPQPREAACHHITSALGSWHYNLNDYPNIMHVIRESPLIDQLISHVLPMREIQAAFELSASHETAKIILQPWP